ncbi:MAG: VOC family protein [Alphaproteobacteria bacterium]|nr:VOC family protein [Alphaproteobacteria bacterium]
MIDRINAYLNFNGQGADALALYQRALGGELVEHMVWADMPGQEVAPEMAQRIMHATLQVDGFQINVSDVPPHWPLTEGNRFSVMVQFTQVDELEAAFATLAEGGKVDMPLENTFWGARFGKVTDRFGVSWLFNCQLQQG